MFAQNWMNGTNAKLISVVQFDCVNAVWHVIAVEWSQRCVCEWMNEERSSHSQNKTQMI